jgi:hypothetical protein
MAVRALLAKTQKGPAEVLDLDFGAGGGGYAGSVVALLATQLGVLSLQSEFREAAMSEFLTIQLGEWKLPPVVLQVAAGAINLGGGNVVGAGVITNMLLHPPANFSVAIQAFQAACAKAEIMTRRAFGGTLQGLVSLRERAGRDLRGSNAGE